MIAHSDFAFVIDPMGHMRYILDSNPGPGTEASRSSFAVLLANELRAVLGS
jgi:sensor domain CHASE-containing protein